MSRALFEQIARLRTEQANPSSAAIDMLSTEELLRLMNEEDQKVALAVREEIPMIATAVDAIADAFLRGGRLIYVGAGTSGRLGILDAAECPDVWCSCDYGARYYRWWHSRNFAAQEGAEDDVAAGEAAIIAERITAADVVCGLSASGRTPFVLGALAEAKRHGAYTILVTTNDRQQVQQFTTAADCIIAPNVGPEIIAGSTRLKSGTAQKMVLNMLSTAAMIRIGKTYGNIMVDLQPLSAKLRERAKGIIMRIAHTDYETASAYLTKANGNVKLALIMLLAGCDKDAAYEVLKDAGGSVRRAVELYNAAHRSSSSCSA